MPGKKNKRRSPLKLKPVATNCSFCKGKIAPSYKNYSELEKYITDRAKILPKARTGICAKHQRRLAIEVKRARNLGLLPFTGGL
jgi:small subunit ribosomal protein S18